MTTETDAAHERWQRAWAHREQLLKVARRRSMSLEDAEDAVHEAMLRAAENPHLDDERLGAWLTTVTMRLCVDRYRQVNRETEVRSSPRLLSPVPAPVEEVVCDRDEARWLARRSDELPARQAEALWLKSEDLDVNQVAVKMGLSYRTVESLLARARRTLRNSLAATLGLALWLIGRGRPRGGNTQAVAVASTAATLAVVGLILPYAHDGDRPAPSRPSSPAVSPARNGDGAEPPRGHSPALVPLPEVPLPELPLGTPPVPDIPRMPVVPELPLPPVAVPQVPVPGPTAAASATLPADPLPTGRVRVPDASAGVTDPASLSHP
ncbi:RNA polymerase sigma factor [Streptomyces wuyuanensis]|uniref:RNA polymerase sigma factor n=1 Tax=Streptomyces wuyuanensis TaxID=1196353 RepID=UPI0036CC7948